MPSLAAAERAGAADVHAYLEASVALRGLQLGTFGQGSATSVAARRLLLAAHVPTRVLATAAARRPWLTSYAYWSAVQHSVADRQTWQRLARAPIVVLYHAL